MSWMDEWYRTMALHNQNKCNEDCRHCKSEKAERERIVITVEKAKALYNDLKDTIIAKVTASYNGGYDEGFVDYVQYYDNKNYGIFDADVYKLEEMPQPWQNWTKAMSEIAWGILGCGFGTGDYSCSGSITLDLVNGELLNNKQQIASFKEAA